MSFRFLRYDYAPRLALFFAICVMPDARAEDAGAIDLARALALTTERNPALVAARHSEAIAGALVEQAGYRPNPTLDVSFENFAGTGAFKDTRALEGTVEASQTIERGGKRAKRVALARRQLSIAQSEYAIRHREALSETASAYVAALAAAARLEWAKEPRALAQRAIEAAEERINAAMGSAIELARARAAAATAEMQYAQSEAAWISATSELASRWGALDEAPALPPALPAIPADMPDRNALQARLALHPAIALQQSRTEAMRAELDLQQAHAVNDVTVGAGLRWLRPDDDAALVASVSVPLPFQHRNAGNIRAARESVVQSEQLARAADVELRIRFAGAWRELEAAHRAARTLRADALPALGQATSAADDAHAQGQLPLTEVLEARRALADLRRAIIDADFAYAEALVRVEGLVDAQFPLTQQLFSRP